MASTFDCTCVRCGAAFEGKTRRATYCTSVCRAMASKERRAKPDAAVVAMPGATGAGTIEAAVRAQLGSQIDTVVGRQAVAAAKRLDGGVSDSAFSPISRRLHELLDQSAQAAALAASQGSTEDNPIAFLKEQAERRRRDTAG